MCIEKMQNAKLRCRVFVLVGARIARPKGTTGWRVTRVIARRISSEIRRGNLREPILRTNRRFTVTNFPEISGLALSLPAALRLRQGKRLPCRRGRLFRHRRRSLAAHVASLLAMTNVRTAVQPINLVIARAVRPVAISGNRFYEPTGVLPQRTTPRLPRRSLRSLLAMTRKELRHNLSTLSLRSPEGAVSISGNRFYEPIGFPEIAGLVLKAGFA